MISNQWVALFMLLEDLLSYIFKNDEILLNLVPKDGLYHKFDLPLILHH